MHRELVGTPRLRSWLLPQQGHARPWGLLGDRVTADTSRSGLCRCSPCHGTARLSPRGCARAAAAAAAGSWIYLRADISFQTASTPLGSERVLPFVQLQITLTSCCEWLPPGAAGAHSPPAARKSVPGDWNRTWHSHGTSRVRARGIGLLGKRRKTPCGFVKNNRGMGIDARRGFQHLITSLSEHLPPGQVNPPNPASKKTQGKFPLGLTFPCVNSIYCCLKEVQLP